MGLMMYDGISIAQVVTTIIVVFLGFIDPVKLVFIIILQGSFRLFCFYRLGCFLARLPWN